MTKAKCACALAAVTAAFDIAALRHQLPARVQLLDVRRLMQEITKVDELCETNVKEEADRLLDTVAPEITMYGGAIDIPKLQAEYLLHIQMTLLKELNRCHQ